LHTSQKQILPGRRRNRFFHLDPFLLKQRQVESRIDAAGSGHGVEDHATDDLFFFLTAAGIFDQLQ
jgi:hypothetical protein